MASSRRLRRSDPAPGARADASDEDRWFRAVADFTYDWESWHGPDGRLKWVNPAVERITGYSVDQCLAMADYPLPMIVREDRRRIAEVLASARDRTSGEGVEVRGQHRCGDTRWVSLAWQPMYGEPGQFLGFRTSVRDVTERHKLREELRLHAEHLEQLVQERTARLRQLEERQRQMEKLAALGQLAAGVAHEINNPLAGMRNAFELIKSGLSPDHEHFALLELIDREIERISEIILQMHQLYRRDPLRPGDFSMTAVLDDVTYLLESAAAQRSVTLQRRFPAGKAMARLSEGEVKQICYNLIRNAIQASPAGGVVDVELVDGSDEFEIHVQDQGAGIPGQALSRIFEPFFTTKQGGPESGMGLGLSVSRSLVEAMGGRIEVASGEGRGTRFTAVFPRRLETPEGNDHE